MPVSPYGTWVAPLGADVVAGGGPKPATVRIDDGRLRWGELRPAEAGRAVVLGPGGVEVTPPGANARTRVHELGGGAWWGHGETVFYSELADGRLYRVDGPGSSRVAITPEGPHPHALRYADGRVTPDGTTIVCVRERHEGDEVHNELVALPTDGSEEPHVIASGHDFYAAPRIDPTATRLAWVSWDHPRMPWDGTELWVANIDGTDAQLVAGGPEESVLDPQWRADGELHHLSDRTGWWNLYRGGEQLTSLENGEIGGPAWVFGHSHYAFLDDGRIACIVTRAAVDSIELLDPEGGTLESAGLDWTSCRSIVAGGGVVAFIAESPSAPTTLVTFDPMTGRQEHVRRSLDAEVDPASISIPRAIQFPTRDGAVAHAFYYPPASAEWEGPDDERPPLRVICHGGPTSRSTPHLDLETQYFTQRGIGVVDVNYRGSTGYGREYRRLLEGRWGEIDWQDCVDVARFLAEQGEVDPERTWIEGGSAGGYVVLCALAFEPASFAAGVSLYGIGDVETLARDTHKFESRYCDSLIGPYPERADLYRERSPIHFFDRLERPLLLLQGLDDEIVPPAQAAAMVDVLEGKGIPYAYIPFEGEGHGFRKEENIRRTIEATLAFVGQVFGFEPADELEPLELARLSR